MHDTKSGEILYDHYKDTCSIIGASVKRRDKAMLFVIIAVGFFAFQTIFPTIADHAISSYLSFKLGFNPMINLSVIGNVVWLLVLLFTLRYFQTAVFVERQYAYLHNLEDNLNSIVGQDLVTREGKAYLNEYPWFSRWMWFLYTIIFPILLFSVTSVKIVNEWLQTSGDITTPGLLFDILIFTLLIISIALYLTTLHFRRKKIA